MQLQIYISQFFFLPQNSELNSQKLKDFFLWILRIARYKLRIQT